MRVQIDLGIAGPVSICHWRRRCLLWKGPDYAKDSSPTGPCKKNLSQTLSTISYQALAVGPGKPPPVPAMVTCCCLLGCGSLTESTGMGKFLHRQPSLTLSANYSMY